MDPRIISTDQWVLTTESLRYLVLFVGLVINTAMPFLLAHAVIPSLISSGDVPPTMGRYRRILYPISAVSLVLLVLAFSTALSGFIAMIQGFYPRYAV